MFLQSDLRPRIKSASRGALNYTYRGDATIWNRRVTCTLWIASRQVLHFEETPLHLREWVSSGSEHVNYKNFPSSPRSPPLPSPIAPFHSSRHSVAGSLTSLDTRWFKATWDYSRVKISPAGPFPPRPAVYSQTDSGALVISALDDEGSAAFAWTTVGLELLLPDRGGP